MRRNIAAVLLASGVLLVAGAACAEEFHPNPSLGLKAGVNASSVQVTGASTSNRPGFVGGGYVGFPLYWLTFQVEVLYSQKGFQRGSFTGDNITLTDWQVRLGYIDIPALFRVDVPMDGIVHPYFFAGPSVGIKVSAESRAQETDGQWEDISPAVANTNWALQFGVGLEIKDFLIDARFINGLTDLNKSGQNDPYVENREIKDRTISIMVGYAFKRGIFTD
jgi:hypothetical protein